MTRGPGKKAILSYNGIQTRQTKEKGEAEDEEEKEMCHTLVSAISCKDSSVVQKTLQSAVCVCVCVLCIESYKMSTTTKSKICVQNKQTKTPLSSLILLVTEFSLQSVA